MSNIVRGLYHIGEKIKMPGMKEPQPIKSIDELCPRNREPHEHITVTNGPSFCGPDLAR